MKMRTSTGAVLAGKIRGAMAPERKVEESGSGGVAPENFFDDTFLTLRKHPFRAQRLVLYTRVSYVNERAQMKESRKVTEN